MTKTNRLASVALAVAALACVAPGAGAAALDLRDMTIAQLADAVKSGRVSCTAVVAAEIDRIAAFDDAGPALDAIVTVNPEALADAAALDRQLASGASLRAAHCLPVVLKDNIETAQVRTTFGSPLFADWTPAADAPVVARLRAQGAIVLAKGNLDDFAAAVYGVSELDGVMRNPYDQTRTVGGSSGGPAASVAAGYAPLAIGTDTGGSLRIPAAFNSVVTIRPTMGLVSRSGMSPRALTQDTAGPLARTVADAAAGLDLIAGPDPSDPLTSRGVGQVPGAGYASFARGGRLDGVRIGAIRQGIPLFGAIGTGVAALEERAIEDLEALGATVVDLPQSFVDALDRGFACNDCLLDSSVIGLESRRDLTAYLGALAPAAPVASFDALYNGGVNAGRYTVYAKEAFDREATVDLTDPARTTEYQTMLDRQEALRDATLDMLAGLDLDAVLYPTATRFPDPIGDEQDGVFTRWSEHTGFPTISVPMGYGRPQTNQSPSTSRLPAGLELLAGPFDEPELIRIASAYERATQRRRAPVSTPPTFLPLPDPPAAPGSPEPPAAPPAPAPPVVVTRLGDPVIGRGALRVGAKRRLAVRITCAASRGERCTGRLRIDAGRRVLAQRRFSIPAGRATRVRVTLRRADVRQLAGERSVRATVTVTSRGADGVLRETRVRVPLRVPRRS